MDENQFSIEQRRHLVKTLEGAWAFVPPPLPPEIEYSRIAHNLASCAKAIGELNGAARRLQYPYMLVTPLVRKEALTTSAMEGTITTIDNMLVQEILPDAKNDDDAREAFNYLLALRHATEELNKLPLTGRIIKESHAKLLSGLSPSRGANKLPGTYKTHQNAIGQSGDTVFTARYVPPPPAQTVDAMSDLEKYINRANRVDGDELVDLAIAHYQFEAIHPFQDGNGRIGRMLVTLMAMQMKLVSLPILHISSTLEAKTRKTEYIEKLFQVSAEAAWTDWINFFLVAVKDSCTAAINIADRIIELQASLKRQALGSSKNHRLQTIIDALFNKPWTTAPEVETMCKVTFPTAQSDIQELMSLGVLNEIKGTRPAVFVANQILNVSRR